MIVLYLNHKVHKSAHIKKRKELIMHTVPMPILCFVLSYSTLGNWVYTWISYMALATRNIVV